MSASNRFETFFQAVSYAVVLCGLISLLASGSIGIVLATFFLLIVFAGWMLEGRRWQLSERVGTGLIIFLIPVFYLDWKYGLSGYTSRESLAAGSLARSILILAAVKLLQRKSYRDWIFLYVISFFEILLAAGLSVSPVFIISLTVYLICATCAIVAFEIKKTAEKTHSQILQNEPSESKKLPILRIPLISIVFLLIVSVFAVPLFFALPRTGNAGFGKNLDSVSVTGFSDSVHLGDIASVQQNNEIVMRVRIDDADKGKTGQIRWRGVALDTFDNKNWKRTRRNLEPFIKTEQGFYQIDYAQNANNLVAQTFYLEPLETPVLFSLAHPVALQGNFPVLNKDAENSLSAARNSAERTTYKVYSDATMPSVERLRADNDPYSMDLYRYLKQPYGLDDRIAELTLKIITDSKAQTRYDEVKAVENYLKTNYAYTLDLKESGDQPLADFLFNIKAGHCEYFATALAIMLRTQGMATRIVNGFQAGEYNQTADVYVVRQREAHSWVEVYFPQENVWVPFDATPAAGQFSSNGAGGIIGSLNQYAEALETFWIQYVVAYDNQEQKSLMRSLRSSLVDLQAKTSSLIRILQKNLAEWWKQARGDQGFGESLRAIGGGVLYLLGAGLGVIFLFWLYRKIKRNGVWKKLLFWLKNKRQKSIVEFYERMQKVLASKGFEREPHQTPLEFAFALNMPEAVSITEKYNRVRFGEKNLSNNEAEEIESWLDDLKNNSAVEMEKI